MTTSAQSMPRETIVQHSVAAASMNGVRHAQPAARVSKADVVPNVASAVVSQCNEGSEMTTNNANNQNQQLQAGSESPAFDFKTARQLLVQRSSEWKSCQGVDESPNEEEQV